MLNCPQVSFYHFSNTHLLLSSLDGENAKNIWQKVAPSGHRLHGDVHHVVVQRASIPYNLS